MSEVERKKFVREAAKEIKTMKDRNIFVVPDLDKKKVHSFLDALPRRCDRSYDDIVLHYDATIFGSANEGFILTDSDIVYRYGKVSDVILYKDMEDVSIELTALFVKKHNGERIGLPMNQGQMQGRRAVYDVLRRYFGDTSRAALSKIKIDTEKLQKIENGDLYALLSVCSAHDLDPIVKLITDRISNDLALSGEYQMNYPDHTKYYKRIGDELRQYGGNTLKNLMRGGEGPSYDEIVIDVCKKMGAPYVEGKTVLNEVKVLTHCTDVPVDELTPDDREKLAQKGKKTSASTYAFAAATIVLRVNPIVNGALLASWAFSPAMKVTAPSVLHLAALRQQILRNQLTQAAAAAKIRELEEKLSQAACAFSAHDRLDALILCLVAVGYAIAACDGPVSQEEKIYIEEFAAGAARYTLNDRLRDKIGELERNPPDFGGAMKYVEKLGPEAWPLVDDLLSVIAESDEPTEKLNEFETQFCADWSAFKRENANREISHENA